MRAQQGRLAHGRLEFPATVSMSHWHQF
jgi:hypothetical protein